MRPPRHQQPVLFPVRCPLINPFLSYPHYSCYLIRSKWPGQKWSVRFFIKVVVSLPTTLPQVNITQLPAVDVYPTAIDRASYRSSLVFLYQLEKGYTTSSASHPKLLSHRKQYPFQRLH